jgi:hypothetical protein
VGTVDGASLPMPLPSPYVACHASHNLRHSSGSSTTPPSLGEADGSIEALGIIDGDSDGVEDGVVDGTAEKVGTLDDEVAWLLMDSHQFMQKSAPLPVGASDGTSEGEGDGVTDKPLASS